MSIYNCYENESFETNLLELVEQGRLRSARRLTYPRRAVVYSQGQKDRNLYVVRTGCFKSESYSPQGKVCVHGLCSSGGIFGELSLLQNRRSESVVAMQESEVDRISVSEVLDLASQLGWSEELVGFMANKVARQQRMIESFVTMNSQTRLAFVLLELGASIGENTAAGLRIRVKLSHELLGSMVGTTRSRIGHFLKTFKQQGLIFTCSTCSLISLDVDGLGELLEQETCLPCSPLSSTP